jgi:hypothetical protein
MKGSVVQGRKKQGEASTFAQFTGDIYFAVQGLDESVGDHHADNGLYIE